jgi:two-component system phosphate regulon response regulator PhoB
MHALPSNIFPVARVLIVEDDAGLRRMYRTSLTFAGFEVYEAGDGCTALIAIEQNPPDLVVLDLKLPRLSGHAVQREIAARAHTRHIPIVVVTGTNDTARVPCLLRKPVTPERLIEAVQSCLGAGG